MTTPTLTSNMFENTSHLALSVPHIIAIMKVATGTEMSSFRIKETVAHIVRETCLVQKNILRALSIWIKATEMCK